MMNGVAMHKGRKDRQTLGKKPKRNRAAKPWDLLVGS